MVRSHIAHRSLATLDHEIDTFLGALQCDERFEQSIIRLDFARCLV